MWDPIGQKQHTEGGVWCQCDVHVIWVRYIFWYLSSGGSRLITGVSGKNEIKVLLAAAEKWVGHCSGQALPANCHV